MPEVTHMDKKPFLEVKDLYVSFFTPAGEVRAVNGISFALREGDVLGIVGESGCGKSVSVNAITRLLPVSGKARGGVTLDDQDILAMKERRLLEIRGRDISMIFQDPMTSLNPVYKSVDQIMETLKRHTQMNGEERRERAIDLLKMVGIANPEQRLSQFPHEFSGGMRQRVMIAIALSCNPRLLIADEPTTALDVTIQAQILDLMQNLRREMNASIILITHDLGIVSSLCNHILVMYAGQVVEEGTVDEIFYETAHPYTQGLLKCLPSMLDDERKPLSPIPGAPVDLLMLPAGCPFAARCAHCMRVCLRRMPPPTRHGDTHLSKCWLHTSGGGEHE